MKKTLIIAGHPYLTNDSVANVEILKTIEEDLENVEIVRLAEEYPDFKIDVEREQKRLLEADNIVLQFPYFWYSMPSLLERWMEEVFQFGFSHGEGGDKLAGKNLIASVTTGAPKEVYNKDSFVGYEVSDFLAPLKPTAAMTGMNFIGHVETSGVSYAARTNEKALEDMKKRAREHGQKVIEMIKELEK